MRHNSLWQLEIAFEGYWITQDHSDDLASQEASNCSSSFSCGCGKVPWLMPIKEEKVYFGVKSSL